MRRPAPATPHRSQIQILELADDHHDAHMLALGYPADRPLATIKNPDRRPLEDVVHRGSW